jgi:hypothetical protein
LILNELRLAPELYSGPDGGSLTGPPELHPIRIWYLSLDLLTLSSPGPLAALRIAAHPEVIQEAPLQLWANFRQRALDIAILEINKKTDINIEAESLERSKHRRVISVTFSIQEQAVADGD